MNRTQQKWLFTMAYVLILLATIMPIFANYLLNVGCMEGWVDWLGAINAGWEQYACLFWQMYQVVVQVGTLLLTVFAMKNILNEATYSPAVLIGAGLYMSNQYRWYVSYQLVDLSQALVLMLVPLCVWSLWSVFQKKNLPSVGIAIVVCGITSLVVVNVLPIGQKIMTQTENQPLKGYEIGNLFSCYQVLDGCPGMGLGMFLSIMVGGWLCFVKGEKLGCFAKILLLCVIALTMLTLMGAPAICWGMAQCCLSILGAGAVKRAMQQEDSLIRWGIPTVVLLACIGMLFYQCNGLVHYREPLELAVVCRI